MRVTADAPHHDQAGLEAYLSDVLYAVSACLSTDGPDRETQTAWGRAIRPQRPLSVGLQVQRTCKALVWTQ